MGTVTIGIPYVDRWYFSTLLAGATQKLALAGHSVLTRVHAPTSDARADAAAEIAADLDQTAVVGALVLGFHFDAAQARAALARGKPMASVGGTQLGFPTVMIDDIGASRLATEHLLGLGHRRVLHLAGRAAEQMDFAVHARRRKGYTVAMAAAGLEADVVETAFDRDAAYDATKRALAREDRPTAIFAVSDEMALPAMDAIRDVGLEVGDDVSVVGFDDHPLADAAGLTTVRQSPRVLGETAAGMLLARLEEGEQGDHGSRLMPAPLIERTSARRYSMARALR